MDIDGVLGMLYSPGNLPTGRPGAGVHADGKPAMSPLGAGPARGGEELVVVGVGAKRAVDAFIRASPRPHLLRGGIPVPGNSVNITASDIPGADDQLVAMEEKTGQLERTLGPNNPRTGIALLFLARGYLHTGSVMGADKALFALHKALETLQGYANLVRAPLSAQASRMFETLKTHVLEAKSRAARTEAAAHTASEACRTAGVGPSIATGPRGSEMEGEEPLASGEEAEVTAGVTLKPAQAAALQAA